MKDFLDYCGFMDFWAKSMPETPFGRDAHEKLELFYDIGQLEKIYGQTETLLSLMEELQGNDPQLSLISHHLKRLPRLPAQKQQAFDEIELFQIKKFLHNYRSLMAQLSENALQVFGFEYHSQSLESLLSLGGQSAETFYISDAYSAELASVRAEILETDARMRALEVSRAEEIKSQYGFDIGGLPFLLITKEKLGDYSSASQLLTVEPYDDSHFSVRPLKCAAALALGEKRQALAQKERMCEDAALNAIALEVQTEVPNLQKYLCIALAFDLAWGRARMARECALMRPCLHKKNSIHITKARFAPCESVCERHGIPYTPLDAAFESSATVIFGSNMGGKTVVLQTVALLQLAAQAGLFVPAEVFETRIFHSFHYIGERRGNYAHLGLSGFGVEMQQLMSAWAQACPGEFGSLILMDEFARTTSSSEAEALLAAVLDAISQKANAIAICSTHHHRLPRLQSVRFLRMAGLGGIQGDGHSNDPIREIACRMDYRLMKDDGKHGSDAIAVAQMLGLDSELVKRAKEFFGRQD
jgi:hypothetical protein